MPRRLRRHHEDAACSSLSCLLLRTKALVRLHAVATSFVKPDYSAASSSQLVGRRSSSWFQGSTNRRAILPGNLHSEEGIRARVTVDVSNDNPVEVSGPAASSQAVARHHLAASLGFLILGVSLLALASIQYVAPGLLSGWAPISYGRLRPAAIHFLLYGWLTLGLLGAMYYAVPRLVGVKLTDPGVARAGFILMSVGYAAGGLGILFGQSEGVRYLEAPPLADIIVLLGMMAMAHSIARTIAQRGKEGRSPAEWFMLASVLWLVGLHVIGNLNMISVLATIFWSQPPVLHGLNSAIIAGFYKAGIIGLWGATAGVGIVYFLVPRLVGLSHFNQPVCRWSAFGVSGSPGRSPARLNLRTRPSPIG